MKIEKGDKFICIKDVVHWDSEEVFYAKGKIYESETERGITDENGTINHVWDDTWIDFFQLYTEPDQIKPTISGKLAIEIFKKHNDTEDVIGMLMIVQAMHEYATRAIGHDRERIEQTLESVDDNPILLIDELNIELP